MKRLIYILILTACSDCLAQQKQQFTEHISKQFTLSNPTKENVFSLDDIYGNIKVEGYDGNKIIVEVTKTIYADNLQEMENAKKEFKLAMSQKSDSVSVYIAEPFDSRPGLGEHKNKNQAQLHYHVKLECAIKVPHGISLRLATVNDGDITVRDVYGDLKTNNVNGSITIVNAKGTTQAYTVNGSININYIAAPAQASSYYTLNGRLEVTYPRDFNANVQVKSLNGDFFTDFQYTKMLPENAAKTEPKEGLNINLKPGKDTQLKIGKGGILYKFETLNGNIYIKKAS